MSSPLRVARPRRGLRATAAAVAVLCALSLPSPARAAGTSSGHHDTSLPARTEPVAPEPASPLLTTSVTATLSRSTAPIGRRVVLRGRVDGGVRMLFLETRDSRGRWRTLTRGNSDASGAYTFVTPLWNRTHPLRVLAPATPTATSAVSPVVKLRRTVPSTTGGSTSAWTPIDRRSVSRWDPCTPTSVRINKRYAPAWFATEVKAALRNLHLYTGLDLTYAGSTTQRKPGAWGAWRNADVVLTWSSAERDARLAGRPVAIGGSWFKRDRRADGFVVLDRETRLSRAQWRIVLRHELAHVFGLGHAEDPRQLMHPTSALTISASTIGSRWGRGDIAGLKRIGAAHGCID